MLFVSQSRSGGRAASNAKPKNREAARQRSKKRRQDPELKAHDYARAAIWRKENKEHLDNLHKNNRKNLVPSYVAQSLRMGVKDLTPEIYETQKLIIKLKRELKSNNVKIK